MCIRGGKVNDILSAILHLPESTNLENIIIQVGSNDFVNKMKIFVMCDFTQNYISSTDMTILIIQSRTYTRNDNIVTYGPGNFYLLLKVTLRDAHNIEQIRDLPLEKTVDNITNKTIQTIWNIIILETVTWVGMMYGT
jgi:hypothetical protein